MFRWTVAMASSSSPSPSPSPSSHSTVHVRLLLSWLLLLLPWICLQFNHIETAPTTTTQAPPSKVITYSFAYDVGSHYHNERKDYTGQVKGEYGYWLPDGFFRIFNYTADRGGYRVNQKKYRDYEYYGPDFKGFGDRIDQADGSTVIRPATGGQGQGDPQGSIRPPGPGTGTTETRTRPGTGGSGQDIHGSGDPSSPGGHGIYTVGPGTQGREDYRPGTHGDGVSGHGRKEQGILGSDDGLHANGNGEGLQGSGSGQVTQTSVPSSQDTQGNGLGIHAGGNGQGPGPSGTGQGNGINGGGTEQGTRLPPGSDQGTRVTESDQGAHMAGTGQYPPVGDGGQGAQVTGTGQDPSVSDGEQGSQISDSRPGTQLSGTGDEAGPETGPRTQGTGVGPGTQGTGVGPGTGLGTQGTGVGPGTGLGTQGTGVGPETHGTGVGPGTPGTGLGPGTQGTGLGPGTQGTGVDPGTRGTGADPGTQKAGTDSGTQGTGKGQGPLDGGEKEPPISSSMPGTQPSGTGQGTEEGAVDGPGSPGIGTQRPSEGHGTNGEPENGGSIAGSDTVHSETFVPGGGMQVKPNASASGGRPTTATPASVTRATTSHPYTDSELEGRRPIGTEDTYEDSRTPSGDTTITGGTQTNQWYPAGSQGEDQGFPGTQPGTRPVPSQRGSTAGFETSESNVIYGQGAPSTGSDEGVPPLAIFPGFSTTEAWQPGSRPTTETTPQRGGPTLTATPPTVTWKSMYDGAESMETTRRPAAGPGPPETASGTPPASRPGWASSSTSSSPGRSPTTSQGDSVPPPFFWTTPRSQQDTCQGSRMFTPMQFPDNLQPISVTHDIHENKNGAMKGKYVMNFPFGFVMEIAYSAYQDPVKAAQYIPMCQAQCCSEC